MQRLFNNLRHGGNVVSMTEIVVLLTSRDTKGDIFETLVHEGFADRSLGRYKLELLSKPVVELFNNSVMGGVQRCHR